MPGISAYIITRGSPDKLPFLARTYNGVFYTVRFRIDQPVDVIQVGFFGPCLEDQRGERLPAFAGRNPPEPIDVLMKLEFKQSPFDDLRLRDEELQSYAPLQMIMAKVPVDGPRGEVFLIQLPQEVKLPAKTIIDLRFELIGMVKDLKFYSLPENHYYLPLEHHESGTNWEFFNSARQVACLGFTKTNPGENERQNVESPLGDEVHEPEEEEVVEEPALDDVVEESVLRDLTEETAAFSPAPALTQADSVFLSNKNGGNDSAGDIRLSAEGLNDNADASDSVNAVAALGQPADHVQFQQEHLIRLDEMRHIYEEIVDSLPFSEKEDRDYRPFLQKLIRAGHCHIL